VLVVVTHGREQVRDVVVVQRVLDVSAFAAGAHETQRTQDAQVVGGGAEAELRLGGELLDVRSPPSSSESRRRRAGELSALTVCASSSASCAVSALVAGPCSAGWGIPRASAI